MKKTLLLVFLFGVLHFLNAQSGNLVITKKNNPQPLTVTIETIQELDFNKVSGVSCAGTPTVTYAGKLYNTVQIGSQCWLKENLDVGTMVLETKEQTNNGIIEKYCYDNDSANCILYGGLYQWAEAVQYQNGATNTTSGNPPLTGNVQGICPPGWHIPTRTEFETLTIAVNNSRDALLAKGQLTGKDTYGFSALLAGLRWGSFGGFDGLGNITYFLSSLEYFTYNVCYIYLYYIDSYVHLDYVGKTHGFSVRCLKDN